MECIEHNNSKKKTNLRGGKIDSLSELAGIILETYLLD